MAIEQLRNIGGVIYIDRGDGRLVPVSQAQPVPPVPPASPRADAPMSVSEPRSRSMGQRASGLLAEVPNMLNGTGIPERLAVANEFFNPVAGIYDSMDASQQMLAPNRTGYERATSLAEMLTGIAGAAVPAASAARGGTSGATAVMEGLLGGSPAVRSMADTADLTAREALAYARSVGEGDLAFMRGGGVPQSVGAASVGQPPQALLDALAARAQQMELAPADRIQPKVGGAGILDRDYMTPAPSGILPDLSKRYVRNPDPSAPLPKGDRARILVDRVDDISDALAKRIMATGQMNADTRYFYHTDGPIYRAAKAAGLSDDEAAAYLRDLGNNVAATSPRTKVEENLRNATLAMAKQSQGIPFRDVIGVGTGGISEKGYPMMTGKGGIHGILLDDVINNGGMNVATNPKPSNFGPNIAGNRSGVTVDTHAIRGTLQTLNEMQPGIVPEGFILPKFREQYAQNPSTLTPDMIDDTLADQMIGESGSRSKAQTEYAVFADIWHKAAEKLGVSPAEAQSMGWFGFGDETNLGSARKTPVDIFDERLDVTAKALKISPQEAAKRVFRREIPLLGVGGMGLLGAGMQNRDQPEM
jgi:hypothetical protein